ncbi:hypothetical protein O181_056764 [Austropuccinia psidii MF-1]|uniref:Uncharacterized protein n=1 Tax=Austropuccinia psidii MF-1 TaxID=1389203 RepID=A0A9Q3E939_9BASI|nr:hypothetical protein [Austropuccinia psidii MF-1]
MIGRIIRHPGTYWSVPSQLRNMRTILKKSKRSQKITQEHGHISQTTYSHSRKNLSLLGQASSHVESAHSYIRSFINNSNGELSTVFQNFKTAIDIELKNIHHIMGKERLRKLTDVSPPFKQLLGTISIKAIKIIEDQFQKLKHQPNLQPCSKTLTNGMGFYCSHEIEKLLNTKAYIES